MLYLAGRASRPGRAAASCDLAADTAMDDREEAAIFGALVRAYRRTAGLTQAVLAGLSERGFQHQEELPIRPRRSAR